MASSTRRRETRSAHDGGAGGLAAALLGAGLKAGLVAGLVAGLGAALLLGGCVSYTNVPVPDSAPAFESANHTQSISVVTAALDWVISRHPAGDAQGHYAVNLPAGTTVDTAEKIIKELPGGAIVPFEGMSGEIPVYHIGRVWIRVSDAKVDVIYPMTGLDGARSEQNVTVWLSGGVRSWRPYREQYWSAGTIATPPIYIPMTRDEMEQAQEDAEAAEAAARADERRRDMDAAQDEMSDEMNEEMSEEPKDEPSGMPGEEPQG